MLPYISTFSLLRSTVFCKLINALAKSIKNIAKIYIIKHNGITVNAVETLNASYSSCFV